VKGGGHMLSKSKFSMPSGKGKKGHPVEVAWS